MKRLLVCAALAMAMVSCGNGSNSEGHTEDTTSPASGASGQGLDGQGTRGGTGTGGIDETGLDVRAAQPLDTSRSRKDLNDVPGADRSKIGKEGTNNNRGTGGQ